MSWQRDLSHCEAGDGPTEAVVVEQTKLVEIREGVVNALVGPGGQRRRRQIQKPQYGEASGRGMVGQWSAEVLRG